MKEKIYFTCFNKNCSNYVGMSCSCHCGDYADTCEDRISESEYRKAKEKETVNHPNHYNTGKFETIEVIEDWNLSFNLGNAVKYISRCEHKNNKVEDLKKAIFYINREIEKRCK